MYLDDGGEDTLSVEYTRDMGGAFVRLRVDGTDVGSCYASSWHELETFARELLAVAAELEPSGRCSAPITCGRRTLPTLGVCYEHGGRP